jgi:GH15 family glucan-1,4-alpha-glucosidase
VTIEQGQNEGQGSPSLTFRKEKRSSMLGEGVTAQLRLTEGQTVSFVLRADVDNHVTENITTAIVDKHQNDTQTFWFNWLSKSKYRGGWREIVARSLLILKLLTYEPTGAIVAAPTFSIPEDVGGARYGQRHQWDP